MAKYKRYDFSQSILIPVCFEEQLIPGTLEFAIHALVETRMDMSIFDNNYQNDETGRSAYDPKVLLKVVLFAYSRGLISSRKIERACCENVTFMALSGNQRPDHSTIAAFVSCMQDEILPLFRDILLFCDQENLLGGTFFALDGLKLPGNASKRWSGSLSDISKKKQKIEQKIKGLLKEQISANKEDRDGLLDPLNRQKQIEKLQKQAERIERWLAENDAKIGANGRELQSNVTDNESAKMMTSHGTIQGYNAQALVDKEHQVIMHAEAFGNGQDNQHLAPMVDGGKENLNFKYDEAKDCYICPNGKVLKLNVKKYVRDRNIYRRYIADAKDCKQCSLKSRCFYRKNTKRRSLNVPIGAAENNFSKAMLEKVDSDRGRKIYPQRMAIVEPVFANIRTQARRVLKKSKSGQRKELSKRAFSTNSLFIY
mgnify:CR=1 FL=1